VNSSGESVVNRDDWDEEFEDYDKDVPIRIPITPPGNFHNMRRRNKNAKEQWKEALRKAMKTLGHPVSQAIQERVHREIHNNDLDIDDIVERIISFYGK
jgi:hypothetical protein